MKKVLTYKNCFICGKESVNGLHVDFVITESGARAECNPGPAYEGFSGIVHGGILSALLDEVMWKAINGHTGELSVTARMEIRFKKPALVGTNLTIEGSVTGQRRRVFETAGAIYDPEGEKLVEATGTFIAMDADSAEAVRETLE